MMIERRMQLSPYAPARALIALALVVALAQPAASQAYKETFNTGIETARAGNLDEARGLFMQAASGADAESDAAVARRARDLATKIDYKLGKAAFDNENYEVAITYFDRGIEADASYTNNQHMKGLALKRLDRIEEAMTVWSALLENSDRAAVNRASDAIRDHYHFAASTAISRNGAAATEEDASEALAALETMMGYGIEADADTYYYQAEAAKIIGDYAQAVTLADQAIEIHRGSLTDKAKLYFVKGESLMYSGDTAGAKEAFAGATYGQYKASAEHWIETL